jgi:hypothetical protein
MSEVQALRFRPIARPQLSDHDIRSGQSPASPHPCATAPPQTTAAERCVYVQARALDRKANKAEKMKVQKDGSVMWTEIEDLAALIRSGKVQETHALSPSSGQFGCQIQPRAPNVGCCMACKA